MTVKIQHSGTGGMDFRIANEQDAFDLVQRHLSGSLPAGTRLELDGWPKFKVKLQGEGFDQTITPPVMRGFIELQKSLYRAYAATKYNDPTKRLTDAEKEALEIRVKVEKGSSNYEIDFQELLLELVKQVGGRMDTDHALIAAVVIALLFFGKASFSAYLDNRRSIRERELKSEEDRELIRTMNFMSEQETARMKLLHQLTSSNHRLDNVSRIAHDAHTEMVKSFANAERAEVDGIEMSGEVADLIIQNARQKSTEIRLDGIYRISRVDWSDPTAFKVKVYNVQDEVEVEAAVKDTSLNSDNKKALQEAEWERRAVRLKINAKELRGKIHDAVIIGVDPVHESSEQAVAKETLRAESRG